MTKLVSVITPAYNTAHTLRKCVESVRLQTYPHWEHIIIDDGSTDESWELLHKLSLEDSRLRIIRQDNAGQGAARNAAIQIARGKYIALLDADDYSIPERLAMQVAFLDAHLDVDVLGGGFINITESGEDLGISLLPVDHDTLSQSIYRICPFYTSAVMARANFFEILGGFAENLPRAEDYDLWLRGYRRFRYHNLQIPLTYYRRDTRPSWRNARYSAQVILRAVKNERRVITHGWYALRSPVWYLLTKYFPKSWFMAAQKIDHFLHKMFHSR